MLEAEPQADRGLADAEKPWLHIASAVLVDGEYGLRRVVRSRDTDELQVLTDNIERFDRLGRSFLDLVGLPQPRSPSLWMGAVLPAVREELARRRRPTLLLGKGRIARLKAKLRLEDVAARFTELRPAGPGKLKGLCPMHSERSPSFYIYLDSQRWSCFGACSSGGDVLDLAEQVREIP